jgi:hypothetical protein
MMTFFKRYESLIALFILTVFLIIFSVIATRAQETREEQQTASQELGAFAGSHNIDYWSCEPSQNDGTWTAELGSRGGKDDAPLLWHEEGYTRLIDAVSAVEQDYTTYPEGHSGQAK